MLILCFYFVEYLAEENVDDVDDELNDDRRLLYANAPVTVSQINYLMTNFIHTQNLPLTSVQPLLNMISAILPPANNLVKSTFLLMKDFTLSIGFVRIVFIISVNDTLLVSLLHVQCALHCYLIRSRLWKEPLSSTT